MSFLDQFRPPAPAVNGHAAPVDFWTPFRGGGQGYAHAALEREVDELTRARQPGRNHALNQAAFSLGQLVAGGALVEAVVVDALRGACIANGLANDDGKLAVDKTIQSGLRAGGLKPRGVPERAEAVLYVPVGTQVMEPVDKAVDEPVDEAAQVREHLPRLDWKALWADDQSEEWIVEPLLPARRLVALYSPPKVGKSLLMLELAVAVANGTDILGVKPDRPRRVLYVDFENDPAGDIRERLMAMGYGPDDLDNLVYLSFPQLAALDSAEGGRQLMAAVATYACEVVVVDTISRAIQGEENENDTWLNFYRHTGKALKAAGVALVRLDHTGKDETKGQRGGSAKSGDVDAVWRMSEVTKGQTYRLDCEANRMPITEKTLVIHRDLTPHLRHRVDSEGRYAAWRAKVAEIASALDVAGVPRDAGRNIVRETLRTTGLKASDAVLKEVIAQRRGIDAY